MSFPDVPLGQHMSFADAHEALIQAQQIEAVEIEKVMQACLFCASDNYNQVAEDPGWNAEYHEKFRTEAILSAAAAIERRKQAEANLSGAQRDETA